jgi:hypothetical protein
LKGEKMDDIVTGIQVLIILLGVTSPIIVVGVVYYLKKRLEHKQIMAAIEKGIPLSELVRPKPQLPGPGWIRYVSIGIMLLIISLGFLLAPLFYGSGTVIAFALTGVGTGWLVRGLLHRKYHLIDQSANQNNMPPNKASA